MTSAYCNFNNAIDIDLPSDVEKGFNIKKVQLVISYLIIINSNTVHINLKWTIKRMGLADKLGHQGRLQYYFDKIC